MPVKKVEQVAARADNSLQKIKEAYEDQDKRYLFGIDYSKVQYKYNQALDKFDSTQVIRDLNIPWQDDLFLVQNAGPN